MSMQGISTGLTGASAYPGATVTTPQASIPLSAGLDADAFQSQQAPAQETSLPPGGSTYDALAATRHLPTHNWPGFNFDLLRLQQLKPNLYVSPFKKASMLVLHPLLCWSLRRQQAQVPENAGEDFFQRAKMYLGIRKALDISTRQQLKTLLNAGTLNDNKSENNHTKLYELYSMLTTRRSPGYSNKILVKEAVELLSQPQTITQRFKPISENAGQQILSMYNNPGPFQQHTPSGQRITWSDLQVDNSATCVSSSVTLKMDNLESTELIRQLNEATSPLNAFFEKVRLDEISPDDPSKGWEMLNQRGIPYSVIGPGEVIIKATNPPAGVIRAIDSQGQPAGGQYRGALQSVYQTILTHLAAPTYDPATDLRDSDVPGEPGSKGLISDENEFMEACVRDGSKVASVEYQAVDAKSNPAPGEESNSYLYGYKRPFDKTAADLIETLKMQDQVVVGLTDTDESGSIVGAHEVTIIAAKTDPVDGQLKFIEGDSDDGIPTYVTHNASELLPRIHHMMLPYAIAQRTRQEMETMPGYLVPDQTDAVNGYKLLNVQTGPMPSLIPEQPQAADPAFTEPTSAPSTQTAAPQPPAQQPGQPTPQSSLQPLVVDWMPIYPNPTTSQQPAGNPFTLAS